MKHLLVISICIVVFLGTTLFFAEYYYPKKFMAEYQRGIMDGAGYYERHGNYPSMWHWQHKFYDPEFNIDTIIPPLNKDSIHKEFMRKMDSGTKQ